jgi:O-antigen/teichoic acid export membrane protein
VSESTPGEDAQRPDLGRRFLLGSAQLGAGSWLGYAINFAIQIALARLLGPEQFGLYAFVLAIDQILCITGAFSLGTALIQARAQSQGLYDTAAIMCAALGLIGLALAAAIAPFLWHYRSPDAAWFLLVMGMGRVVALLGQVPHACLERTLNYGRITAISVASGSLPNFVALGLALGGIGAWVLVIRDVLVPVVAIALELVVSGYRFRGQVSWDPARRLISFSVPMFFARGIDILIERVDRVTVGAFFGNTAAGLLDRARFLSDTGLMVVRPIDRLSLNLFSRVQDEPARLSRAYTLVNFFMMRVTFAGAAVLLIFPTETVRLIYGEEWLGAAPILQWLALYAAFIPILALVKALIVSQNATARIVRISGLQATLLLPGIAAAAFLGSLTGVAAAITLSTTVALLISWRFTRDLVSAEPLRLVLTPAAVLGTSVAALALLRSAGFVEGIPWPLRPALPAALYCIGLLLVERSRLFRELGYLRAQLAGGAAPPASGDEA